MARLLLFHFEIICVFDIFILRIYLACEFMVLFISTLQSCWLYFLLIFHEVIIKIATLDLHSQRTHMQHAHCTLKNERKYLTGMLQATMLALSSKPLFPAINLTIGCNSTNRLSESSKQCVCVSLIFRGFLFLAKIPN